MVRNGKSVCFSGTAGKNNTRQRAKCFPTLTVALFILVPAVFAGDLILGNFRAGDLAGWKPKIFHGETSYSLVVDGDARVLKAHSRAAASGLYKGVEIDPAKYPILRWSWKIGGTIPDGDERTKAGDDYAARVYIVFPRTLFWKTKAINYIWANRLPQGESLPNAFTSNAVMVAVESGNGRAGTWVTEERNVYEDYRTLFGEDPPFIGAVALMTDTDNTGEEAVAYYGDIVIGPAR